MTTPPSGFFLSLAVLISSAAFAAEPPPSAPAAEPLRAMATSVEDTRSTTSGSLANCRVTLSFVGDEIADTEGILSIRATKATDDLDRDLILPPESARRAGPLLSGLNSYRLRVSGAHSVASIVLRNPSRRASTIKRLEGSVELYHPTETNGAIITLPGVLAQPGVIKNAALEKQKIELKYLTEEEAARLRPFPMATPIGVSPSTEDERRRLDAVAEEVARRRALRETGMDMTAQALSLPPSAATVTTEPSTTGHVVRRTTTFKRTSLEVKDPDHKLVHVDVRDAKGEPLANTNASVLGDLCIITSAEPLPADAQLIVHVATPESVQSRSFVVENIALP